MKRKLLETETKRKADKKFPLHILILELGISSITYIGTSLADGAITILSSIMKGEGKPFESNPIAFKLMDSLGYAPGMAISLLTEYTGMLALTRLLPEKLRPVPLFTASYIHLTLSIGHLDCLTAGTMGRIIPDQIWQPLNSAMYKLPF